MRGGNRFRLCWFFTTNSASFASASRASRGKSSLTNRPQLRELHNWERGGIPVCQAACITREDGDRDGARNKETMTTTVDEYLSPRCSRRYQRRSFVIVGRVIINFSRRNYNFLRGGVSLYSSALPLSTTGWSVSMVPQLWKSSRRLCFNFKLLISRGDSTAYKITCRRMISSRIIYFNATYPEYISYVVSFVKFSPEKRFYTYMLIFLRINLLIYITLINHYFFNFFILSLNFFEIRQI